MVLSVVEIIPPPFQYLFDVKYSHFNDMQSIVAPQIIHTDFLSNQSFFMCQENVVVAAPTGSGKTVLHELCIVRLMMTRPKLDFKCLLLAPSKALCQQRLMDWNYKFATFGVSMAELTGDVDVKSSFHLIASSTVIIATPEKWDSLTRSWRQHLYLLGTFDLLMIDEIHLLGDDRGAILEMIVVRMQILRETYRNEMQRQYSHSHLSIHNNPSKMRIVTISATFVNLEDIATWIECKNEYCHYFTDDFRPVPLQTHVIAFGSSKNPFLFDKSLDSNVANMIRKYGDGKQVLVFCSSKSNTESLASKLCTQLVHRISNSLDFMNTVYKMDDNQLRLNILRGSCGYHHAGLSSNDRIIVETLFIQGYIQVLCSTSTLAHGINLPAHLVIVKGTNSWKGASIGYERMKRSDVIQMLGRAGRPGFDTFGVAVIMTSNEEKQYYEDITNNSDIVESNLFSNITEAICVEVTQSIIKNIPEALTWMKKTFLYVRVMKNPSHYGMRANDSMEDIHFTLERITIKSIEDLANGGIVMYDRNERNVKSLNEAHIMSKNIIKFTSMIKFIQLAKESGIKEVLHCLSECEEISINLRRQEKRFFNDVVNQKVKYSLSTKISSSADKAFLLLQAAISNLPISDFYLRVEQADMVEKSLRLLSAVKELSIEKGYGELLRSAINLDRFLRCRLWDDSYATVFSQCPNLSSNTVLGDMVTAHIRNFEDLIGLDEDMIQRLLKCNSVDAHILHQYTKICLHSQLALKAVIMETRLMIHIYPKYSIDVDVSSYSTSNYPCYQLLCYHIPTSTLLCHRSIPQGLTKECNYDVPIDRSYVISDVQCCLIADIIGIDYYSNQHVLDVESNINLNDKRLSKSKKTKQSKIVTIASTKSKSEPSLHLDNLKEYGYFPSQNQSIHDKALQTNAITHSEPNIEDGGKSLEISSSPLLNRKQNRYNEQQLSSTSLSKNSFYEPRSISTVISETEKADPIQSTDNLLPSKVTTIYPTKQSLVSPNFQTLKRKATFLPNHTSEECLIKRFNKSEQDKNDRNSSGYGNGNGNDNHNGNKNKGIQTDSTSNSNLPSNISRKDVDFKRYPDVDVDTDKYDYLKSTNENPNEKHLNVISQTSMSDLFFDKDSDDFFDEDSQLYNHYEPPQFRFPTIGNHVRTVPIENDYENDDNYETNANSFSVRSNLDKRRNGQNNNKMIIKNQTSESIYHLEFDMNDYTNSNISEKDTAVDKFDECFL